MVGCLYELVSGCPECAPLEHFGACAVNNGDGCQEKGIGHGNSNPFTFRRVSRNLSAKFQTKSYD